MSIDLDEPSITVDFVKERHDGGLDISLIFSKDMITGILTQWVKQAIQDSIDDTLHGLDETPEVSKEDGSSAQSDQGEEKELFGTGYERDYLVYNDGPPNPSDQR